MTYKESKKLIFFENEYFLTSAEDIRDGDWYLWLYGDRYHVIKAQNVIDFSVGIKEQCFKILASTKQLEGCALLEMIAVDNLISVDEVSLQNIIDKRNTPDRYYIGYSRYLYSEQDIKNIVKEYETQQLEYQTLANRTEWQVEIEMTTSYVMGGGLLPSGQIGGKGNTRYETHSPSIKNGFINILKLI